MGIAEVVDPVEDEEIRRGNGDDDDTHDRLFMLAVGPPLKAAPQEIQAVPQAPAHGRWRPAGSQTCGGSSDMRNMLDAAHGRQVDGDGGPGADGAGDVQGPAVDVGQLDGKRKAAAAHGRLRSWGFDARASMPGISVMRPVGALLRRGDLLLGDAHPGVGNGEAQAPVVPRAGDDRDLALGRR